MSIDKGPEKIGDLFKSKTKRVALPAYAWQELALRIIKDLNIPNFKRSAVFKVCKEKPRTFIEKCLNDTKELCREGEPWKYFFKIVGGQGGNLPAGPLRRSDSQPRQTRV